MRVSALCQGGPSSPPVPSAMANSGPKGRGVKRGSQVPHSTACGRATSSQNERRRAVLPTPASPQTTTTVPRPPRPTEASASLSTANWPARSSSSSDRPGTASDNASLGHAQWCTLLAAVSTVARISPTGQELPHHGEIAAQWLKMAPRGEARPKRPVPKWATPVPNLGSARPCRSTTPPLAWRSTAGPPLGGQHAEVPR